MGVGSPKPWVGGRAEKHLAVPSLKGREGSQQVLGGEWLRSEREGTCGRREAQAQGQWSLAAQVHSPGQELDPVSPCILPAWEAGPRRSLRACAGGSRGGKRLGMRSGYREVESSARTSGYSGHPQGGL